MAGRLRLHALERAALRGSPPKDATGQLVPWRLEHVAVEDEEWADAPFVIAELTAEDVVLERVRWRAQVVFSGCVFRGVRFEDVAFDGLRFEDVLFEDCDMSDLALDGCSFLRCRFYGGSSRELRAVRSEFAECAWTGGEADAPQLEDCQLRRCSFDGTRVGELRATRCLLSCRMAGGAVDSADLTACKAETVELEGTGLKGVRMLGVDVSRLSLARLEAGELALGQCKVAELSMRECDGLTSLSLVGSTIDVLRIEASAGLRDIFVQRSTLRGVSVTGSTLADTTFDDVDAPGAVRIEGTTLAGAYFKGGVWAHLSLRDVLVSEYLAVDGASFSMLEKHGVRESDGLRRRLEGNRYGAASMTWESLNVP